MESHRFQAADGVGLRYLTAGTSGSWVVLLHGRSDSAERMWASTGILDALSADHRVVALDLRNHGKSEAPGPGLEGRAEDAIDLMDHLGIDRAHIHGYSMGGAYALQLLGSRPERFLTAGLCGAGVMEVDERLRDAAAELDPLPPGGSEAPLFPAVDALVGMLDVAVDLGSLDVPILSINGEYDRPCSKTQRLWREARTFHNVVLPGCDHLVACGYGAPIPPAYVAATAGFIAMYDDAGGTPVVRLDRYDGPWAQDDPDANFKQDVALYSKLEPLDTLQALSGHTGIPVGALVRYILGRWASAGAESLLAVGPSVVERMWSACETAEAADTPAARLEAYETLRQMLSWLREPLTR
jgi:pimeloyl-ACP methyl ester carboxylesterase